VPTRDDVLDKMLRLDAELDAFERDAAPASPPVPVQPEDWAALMAKYDVAEADPAMRTCDHVASCVAGVAGSVLDISKSWDASMTSEDMHQRLDRFYKQKVESVTGGAPPAIDNNIGGGAHRLVGPTHDIGRLWAAIQTVRSGRFRSAVGGDVREMHSFREGLPEYARVDDPADALMLLVLHWAADFFSKMSLPIPGWSRLAESIDAESVRAVFSAYRQGKNLRSEISKVLSNLSGVALISVLLRIYRYLDMFVVSSTHAFSLSVLTLGQDVRFRWMTRNANLIAVGFSTGRVFAMGNPVLLNYGAFFKFWQDARAIEKLLDQELTQVDARVDAVIAEERSWSR